MENSSDFPHVNTCVQILVCHIYIVTLQQVCDKEIFSMGYLINDSWEYHCHSGYCDHQGWLTGRDKCWMPVRWSCLYLQQVAWCRIQSLKQIPQPLLTNNTRQAVVCHNHPPFKGFPPYNGQWQPHVLATHDCGRVTAILYCLPARRHSSPAIMIPIVKARMPVSGLLVKCMVNVGIQLQTWMRVIVDADV